MPTEPTPEEMFNAESPERMVPRALLQGRHRDDVVADLVRLDWPRGAAEALVKRVAKDLERHGTSPESRAALLRECRKQMFGGLLLAFLGLFASVLSAFAAVAGIMHLWFLFWGAILVGLALTIRGYSRWRLYRSASISDHHD